MRRAARAWLAAGAITAAGTAALSQSAAATAGLAEQGRSDTAGLHAVPVVGSGYVPGHRLLYPGTRGADVRALQRRLNFLHYYAGPANGVFGQSTLEAVWAFKEVQSGRAIPRNPNSVSLRNQRQLVNPKLPPVLVRHGGSQRIEVSKKLEVLVLYRDNKVALISHVSTGGGYYFCSPHGGGCGYAITPDGNYRALSFLPGWVKVPLGTMYNPVFFIGRSYAIHGDVPVPLAPVSHGCVRIPMHIAAFFHYKVHLGAATGTPVFIRGPRV